MSILDRPFDSTPALAVVSRSVFRFAVAGFKPAHGYVIDCADYDVGSSVKITNRARRFLSRHSSVGSKQAGASLP